MATTAPTTKSAEQFGSTPLADRSHEWRQWLAPGVLVAIVLAAMGMLRNDMGRLRGDLRDFRLEINTHLSQQDKQIDALGVELKQDIDDIRQDVRHINTRIDPCRFHNSGGRGA